jgi:hypothetical protein
MTVIQVVIALFGNRVYRFLLEGGYLERTTPMTVEGYYEAFFEHSDLNPLGSDTTWWLESNNRDFFARYDALPQPPLEPNFPYQRGPRAFLRLRGNRIGPRGGYPQGYGHLGNYPYKFYVEEVLEMRLADTSEERPTPTTTHGSASGTWSQPFSIGQHQ